MKKIFIDGKSGTTGLKIYERLEKYNDIELLLLPEEKRKDINSRKEAINNADIVFLCLPDQAAIEAVSLVENPSTIIIDTSTAHRTDSDWAYGFPELSEKFENKIKTSKRISVPGCHATGFISLVYPLLESKILKKDVRLTCHSITGYSGGGKGMIAEYESENKNKLFDAPRQYAISQTHKHLKEMQKITGLDLAPVFCPIVSNYYSGMLVTVPLFKEDLVLGKTFQDIKDVYSNKYTSEIVKFFDTIDEKGFVSASHLSGKDSMQITVAGNQDRILLLARYDNLGKGASGAALECLNLVLEKDENTGLVLK